MFFLSFKIWNRVSCIPGWPWTHPVSKYKLNLLTLCLYLLSPGIVCTIIPDLYYTVDQTQDFMYIKPYPINFIILKKYLNCWSEIMTPGITHSLCGGGLNEMFPVFLVIWSLGLVYWHCLGRVRRCDLVWGSASLGATLKLQSLQPAPDLPLCFLFVMVWDVSLSS